MAIKCYDVYGTLLYAKRNLYVLTCNGRLLVFQDRMEVWLCFWATLMFATLTTATSKRTCVNDTLIAYETYFMNLRDYNCSENYRNLRRIHLANNNLYSFEGTGLSDVSGLLYLVVVHNLLTSLDPDFLSSLTELIFLDLSYNKLESFKNEQLFASQSKLEVLRLSHNRIVTLDFRVLAPLHALKELNLSDNPFCCDCELRHTVTWCAERNLSTGAACENGVPWTGFSYENCTSVTFVVTGIGIGIVVVASIVVEAWVCLLRRARHDTIGTEPALLEDTLEYRALEYCPTTRSNQQTCQSSCSTQSLLFKPTAMSSSPEYAQITQRQDIHHTETGSNPGTEPGVPMSPTYAEPYQHITEASGTYSVPYDHTAAEA